MKKSFFGYIIPACLVLLLLPSYGWSKTAKIAVFPWKVNSAENMDFVKGAIVDMLSSRLGAHQSVEMIRPDAVKGVVSEKTEVTDAVALEAGKKLKADYVVYGSLTVLGTAVSLDAKVVESETGRATALYSKADGLGSIIGLVDKLSKDTLAASGLVAALPPPPAMAETPKPMLIKPQAEKDDSFLIKPREETQKSVLWKSAPVEGLFKSVLADDLDKDGSKEAVLLSGKSIIISRVKPDGIETIKEIKASGGEFFSASVIDSDKDGFPEIYISKVEDEKAASLAVEFRDNDYKVIAKDIPFLVRTIDVDGKGAVLIGQRLRKGDGLYGPLRVLEKKGGGVVDKAAFDMILPGRVDIFDFDAVDLTGDNEPEIAALDERGYLHIYRKSKEGKWEEALKSVDFYGGTLNYIRFSEASSGATEAEPVVIEGRFFHADLNKDGVPELIIKKNTPGGLGRAAERPAFFKSGEIISLSFDEKALGSLVENWRTKAAGGYIADFFVDDLDGDGSTEIIMLIVEGMEKIFGTPKSYVLSHKISL